MNTKSALTQQGLQFLYTNERRIDLVLDGQYGGLGGGFACLGRHRNHTCRVPGAAFSRNDTTGSP